MNCYHREKHSCSFFRWLLAVEYYGYYYCNSCNEKVILPKTVLNKYKCYFLIAIPFWMLGTIVAIEIGMPILELMGLVIGIIVFLILMYICWKKNTEKSSTSTTYWRN